MVKTLRSISWDVDEPTYRADPALSQSTLTRFLKDGFNKLDSLFDKIDTPSLTFGSAVDALITGGQEEFDKNFMVADFPGITDSVLKMVKAAFERWSDKYQSIADIPNANLIDLSEELNYQSNWKPDTRAKVVKEQGKEYYSLLYIAGKKKILDIKTKEEVDACVRSLKNNQTTRFYFTDKDPFLTPEQEPRFVREYQLKFKSTFQGVHYRCMADLLLVDHLEKVVYPVDLKTSSHTEWEFYDSFVQWRYDIQARLYWRIIRDNMDRDPIYKDYRLANYTFIVINRKTLTPLRWEFEDTPKYGTLTYGKRGQIIMEDPFDVGNELSSYLSSRPKVPTGVTTHKNNSLRIFLENMK